MVPALTHAQCAGRQEFISLLKKSTAAFLALGFVMWAGTLLLTRLLPLLLGSSFQESSALLVTLSPIAFLKCASFASAAMLVAVGWQTRRMYVQAVAAGVNVVLNLIVAQQFDIHGVALVYVLSEALLAAGYMILVVSFLRRPPQSSLT
jgi:O-antigen/teichoic acid export membrane protein